jgi:carbonic anhydrase
MPSAIDKALAANAKFALDYDPDRVSPRPRLGLAVLTCMDTRLSLQALGLGRQDAHIIRNAGGIVTDDALRSLLISHYILGTHEVMVVNHTDCGLMKETEQALHDRIEKAAGLPPNSPVQFHAFRDPEENVREQLAKLDAHSWIHSELQIRGFVFDVRTGHLSEVTR